MRVGPRETSSPLFGDPLPSSLESLLSRYWWTFVVRGIVAMVFGAAVYVVPGPAVAGLVLAFGAFAVLDGMAAVTLGIQQFGDERRWWVTLVGGGLSLSAGIVALLSPDVSLLATIWLVGGWAMLRGACDLMAAVQLRRAIGDEWPLAISGVLSLAFGLVLFIGPDAGALALVTFTRSFAFALGVVLVACGLRLRRVARESTH